LGKENNLAFSHFLPVKFMQLTTVLTPFIARKPQILLGILWNHSNLREESRFENEIFPQGD